MRNYSMAELPDGYEWVFKKSMFDKSLDKFLIIRTADQKQCGQFFPSTFRWDNRSIVKESRRYVKALRKSLRECDGHPPRIDGYRIAGEVE